MGQGGESKWPQVKNQGSYSGIYDTPKGMYRILGVLELEQEKFTYLFSLTSTINLTFLSMMNVGNGLQWITNINDF